MIADLSKHMMMHTGSTSPFAHDPISERALVRSTESESSVSQLEAHWPSSRPPISAMPTFPSNPLKSNPVHRVLRKYPALFGVPFVIIIVGASYAMQTFTQTRYDLHDKKVTQVRTISLFAPTLNQT